MTRLSTSSSGHREQEQEAHHAGLLSFLRKITTLVSSKPAHTEHRHADARGAVQSHPPRKETVCPKQLNGIGARPINCFPMNLCVSRGKNVVCPCLRVLPHQAAEVFVFPVCTGYRSMTAFPCAKEIRTWGDTKENRTAWYLRLLPKRRPTKSNRPNAKMRRNFCWFPWVNQIEGRKCPKGRPPPPNAREASHMTTSAPQFQIL